MCSILWEIDCAIIRKFMGWKHVAWLIVHSVLQCTTRNWNNKSYMICNIVWIDVDEEILDIQKDQLFFPSTCYLFKLNNALSVQQLNKISQTGLTHWGRMTHICISKLIIIGSDSGLSPDRRQAIIWTNAGILSIGPLGTNLNEILIEIHTFPFKKMHLKISSAKWQPFCLGPNVLIPCLDFTRGQYWLYGIHVGFGGQLISTVQNFIMPSFTTTVKGVHMRSSVDALQWGSAFFAHFGWSISLIPLFTLWKRCDKQCY